MTFLSAVWGSCGHAAGLGPIEVQSGLGQPLRAGIQLLGADDYGPGCIKASVESLDGAMVMTPDVGLERSGRSASIRLGTRQAVNEPALNIFVRIDCDASVHRDYQILLDPVPAPPVLPVAQQPEADRTAWQSAHPAEAAAGSRVHRRPSAAGSDRTPTISRQAHSKAHLKTRKVRHVLRLSAVAMPNEEWNGTLRLRLADALSPASGSPAALPAEQARPDTQRGDDLRKMRAQMQDLHAEAAALRAETARIRQQNLAYRDVLDSTHHESLYWIRGLAALLAICFVAVGWLLWRVVAMKQTASRPWHEPFTTVHDPDTIDSAHLEGNTEFNTAGTDAAASNGAEPDIAASGPATAQLSLVQDADSRPHPATHGNAAGIRAAELPVFKPAPPIFPQRARSVRVEPEQVIKAEEISDVMELVEAWMTLNAPEKVLDLLRPFSEVEQPESPLPWLCLLDVYRALGDRKKYEAILGRIKTIFNVKLAPWDAQAGMDPPKTLADFPHVIDEILALWQGSDIVPYLESLLRDDRNGTRHGFDLPVYRDILQLIAMVSESGRLTRRDQIMPEHAYAILFGLQGRRPDDAPNRPGDEAAAPAPATTKTTIRERPKYITASYERTIAGRHGATDRPPVAAGLSGDAATATAKKASLPAAAEQRQQQIAAGSNGADSSAIPQKPVGIDQSCTDALQGKSTRSGWTADPDAVPVQPASPNSALHQDDLSPMAIKLHLAIAYQDIGDNEGACLLLDEVIHDGTAEQSQQARLMLAKLA